MEAGKHIGVELREEIDLEMRTGTAFAIPVLFSEPTISILCYVAMSFSCYLSPYSSVICSITRFLKKFRSRYWLSS